MTGNITHRFDRLEIDSFGECIYCGALAKDVELTDEHIIPFSLGGKAVIREGSWKQCARETAKLENEIAHKVLWEFRAHVKSPTRRKKSRPAVLPFAYSIAGRERLTKSVPIADHPFFTPMPVWGRPGLLTGELLKTESNLKDAGPAALGGLDVTFPESYTPTDHQGVKVIGAAIIKNNAWQVYRVIEPEVQ